VRLYLVRHAEAAPLEPDELRPLTPAGREAARDLGKRLAADGVHPDVVLTSPLLRARETATELGFGEPQPLHELGPGATVDDIWTAIAGRGETLVVVGHQPDCSRITAAIRGGPEPAFPPASAEIIEL
jgi:phosphohistidine phosphatase